MIPLFKSNYDGQEANAARAVVEDGWLSMGERVLEFEKGFSDLLGGDIACMATTNCTMSLHLAMLAIGIKAGDEVLVPSLTFVADANVVRMCGAVPVFVDVNGSDNLNISVDDLRSKISNKTKACIVVHFGGFSCEMQEIVEICKSKGIALVEDCAHAPGATYRNRPLGTLGDISCFSFYSNKNLSTGEGGMVCTRNPDLAERLTRLRAHGMTKPTLDKKLGRTSHYDISEPSLNSRIDEIRAAIGVVQLKKLSSGNACRKNTVMRYSKLLENTSITIPFLNHTLGESSYHIMVVLLPIKSDREHIMASLRDRKIQTSLHYRPFWTFEAYKDLDPNSMPNLLAIHERLITLPLSPGFSDNEIDEVVENLLETI